MTEFGVFPGSLCRGGCGAPAAFYCDDCYRRVLTERGGAIDFEAEQQRAKDAALERRLKDAGVPLRYRAGEASLDTYAPKTKGQMDALAAVRDLLDGKPPFALLLVGPVGTGKTHLAASAVALWVRGGREGRFTTYQNLLLHVRSAFDAATVSEYEIVTGYQQIGLLVADDVGVEKASEHAVGTLFNIVNARLEERLPTILTSNFKPGQLAQHIAGGDGRVMAERILSRLTGEGLIVEMDGADMRRRKTA